MIVFFEGIVMSTKMMPVPALEQLEREISGVLNKMTDIRREGWIY